MLGPEHLSYYELEAKPGTRFAHAHGAELERQAEAMEDYFDVVVERLIEPATAGTKRRTSASRLIERTGVTYAPITTSRTGSGVSTSGSASARSRRSAPNGDGTLLGLGHYLAALARGERPEREVEPLDEATRARERVMLGLRLDEGLPYAAAESSVDESASAAWSGWAWRPPCRRGRAWGPWS